MRNVILPLLLYFFSISIAYADVVKPALVEINVYSDAKIEIEIRASVEALLTGINARYKNTREAPTALAYDRLRELDPQSLLIQFKDFQNEMLDQIKLEADGQSIELKLSKITIPEPGYTKVPRISVLQIAGVISEGTKKLRWYYPARFGDNAVRVRQVDLDDKKWHWSDWQWLRNDEYSQTFSLQEIFTKPPVTQTIWSYMVIGFEHIVPKGSDHILFILGLFLFSVRMRPLLLQVTMFTVAHTLTLGLSMNGIINLPSNIVEPLIALSIAYVGIENIVAKRLHNSRLILVFLFGLLHGLGFAGVLNDFGMPENDFVTALISFNIGVELGQLAVISLAFITIGYWFRKAHWYRQRIIVPGSIVISIVGVFWTIDRLSIF